MDAIFDRREAHVDEYSLDIGDFCFAAGANIPSRYIVIFQDAECEYFERDNDYRPKGPQSTRGLKYCAPKSVVLRRLDIMGYTHDVCMQRLSDWSEKYLSRQIWYRDHAPLTPDKWLKTARDCLTYYAGELNYDRFEVDQEDDSIRSFLSPNYNDWGEGSPMHFDGHGSLTSFRIFLELSTKEDITLEVFESPNGDIRSLAGSMCEEARRRLGTSQYLPVIIIPEGSTDSEFLERALRTFYPELRDYFQLFSFQSGRNRKMKVEGSTTNTSFYIHAVAEIAPNNLLLGLYDNDLEGVNAHAKLLASGLPHHVIAMTLPDLEWLRSYPVKFKGADGVFLRDINGRAATIEMFAGKHNLINKGVLPPVETKVSDPKVDKFQGQILTAKGRAQKNFRKDLNGSHPSDFLKDIHQDIQALWNEIIKSVASHRARHLLNRQFPRSFRDEEIQQEMSHPAIP